MVKTDPRLLLQVIGENNRAFRESLSKTELAFAQEIRETVAAMDMPPAHKRALEQQALGGNASARFVIAGARRRLSKGTCSVCRREMIGAYHTHPCE